MDRKTTKKLIATTIVGAAIAAGTLAFTSSNASDAAQRGRVGFVGTFSDIAALESDAAGNTAASTTQGNVQASTIQGSTVQTSTSSTGQPGQAVTIADAPSANVQDDRSDRGRRLTLDVISPDVRLHDSQCTPTSIFDLSARGAADCGLDAGAWSLAVAYDTAANLRDDVDAIKMGAVDTVGATARLVRDTTLETVQDTTQSASELVERATVRAVDTTGHALRTVRDTTLETVQAVGNLVADQTACATGLTGDVLDTSVNDALDCAA